MVKNYRIKRGDIVKMSPIGHVMELRIDINPDVPNELLKKEYELVCRKEDRLDLKRNY